MSIEIDALIETYTTLKEYIPSKERQAACDNLVSVLVDILSDKELREFGSTDNYTKRSIDEYLDDDDIDEDYDEL
jgi:hypothetical protein